MTIRDQAREICKQQLGMHQYTLEEQRIIHKYRIMTAQAHDLIIDLKKGKITKKEIDKILEAEKDKESFRELLNYHRTEVMKKTGKAFKQHSKMRSGLK